MTEDQERPRKRPDDGEIARGLRESGRIGAGPYEGGRLLFPALPLGRWAPLVLGVVAVAVLVTGIVTGDEPTTLLGALGLAGIVVAFPLARFVLHDSAKGEPPEER